MKNNHKKSTIVFIFIAILILSVIFVSCQTLTSEELYEKRYLSYIKRGYPEEDAKILMMTDKERLEYLCPFYDIPVDKREYSYKDKRYVDAIYSFVVGKYSYPVSSYEDLKFITSNHCDIVSFLANTDITSDYGIISCDIEYYSLSQTEMFIRQFKAVKKIQEYHNQIHEQGVVNDSMTEKEKAFAISDWVLQNIGHRPGKGKNNHRYKVETDSIYNEVFGKEANCAACSGVYVILLHLEGIKAQSWHVEPMYSDHGGHFLNRVILDGEEYWADWANYFRGIRKPEEWAQIDGPEDFSHFKKGEFAIELF